MQKIKAALLILLGSFFSCTDDVIQRILAEHGYTPWQIVQGRTFLAILILLPFVIKKKLYKTNIAGLHILRGGLFCCTVCFHVLGLAKAPLALCALIEFTGPLFILLFSRIFLKEKVTLTQTFAAMITFVSVASIIDYNNVTIKYGAIYVLIAMIIYAGIETINKKIISTYNENEFTMIFLYNVYAFAIISIPCLESFTIPTITDTLLFAGLGSGSILFFICFLKAFKLANISFLSTFKYSEFIYKSIFGVLLFNEAIKYSNIVAMGIIILTNIFLIFMEKGENKKQ